MSQETAEIHSKGPDVRFPFEGSFLPYPTRRASSIWYPLLKQMQGRLGKSNGLIFWSLWTYSLL